MAQETLSLLAFADSGTDDNFIDLNLVTKACILTEADNILHIKIVVKVTHHAAPITIGMSGNYSETFNPFLMQFATSPVVLCFSCLKFQLTLPAI